MKRCPTCNLPINRPGTAVTTSHLDLHLVFLVCSSCAARHATLPAYVRHKALDRASAKVMARPDRYMTRSYPSPGAADLAAAMLGHAGFVADLVEGFR